MTVALTFVIPIRHPLNARNWAAAKENLRQTLRSISRQTSSNWSAIVVANRGSDLPQMPAQVRVEYVDFPPNDKHEHLGLSTDAFRDAVRLDKGRRVLAGMLSALPTRYFMVVDDDDFVSRNLVSFVESQPPSVGWSIDKGYLWSEGSSLICARDDFSNLCGTSLIISAEAYDLPMNAEAASETYIKTMMGGHREIKGVLRERGKPLAALPFSGAVYRIGHVNAHSGSKQLLSILFFENGKRKPLSAIARVLLKLRWGRRNFASEFGIGDQLAH